MAVKPKLLRAAAEGDLICQQCHTGLYKETVNAVETHPVGSTADYAAALLASPSKYKVTPGAAAPGVVGLVNGVVSCSSCHGPHFADSDSSTSDGLDNASTLAPGDGHLLKANGPLKADNSVLCQTCHTYMAHGKMSDGGESVGCLTCHSGHIVVGNNNVYVLRNSVTTVTKGTKAITYSAIDTPWNDNTPVTATGYCEVCHGSAETIPKQTGYHLVAAICRDCHMHQIDGGTYSFQNDANAATCGDCHGFPPYKNIRGDRLADAGAFYAERDGGFAYTTATHNYSQDSVTGGYKNETTTPHNTHAAGGLTQGNAATDYIFGAGIQACDPCHLDLSTAPTHDPAVDPGSYQNLAWNSLSTANGLLSPSYAISGNASVIWKCSNTYCHSNGGKRDPDGTKEGLDYTLAVTPAWAVGDNTIIGNAARCNFCHGNTAATMASAVGQKYNSQSHQKHLGTGTFLKTYSCKACHTLTADSNTALASTGTNPRLVKDGGTHVNGVVNVSFNSTFSLGNGTLGTGSYDPGVAGTCTVYCHSNGRAPYTAIITADWDNAASGACGACHSTAAAALSAPHSKHLAITGVVCADCHGTGAAAGTHSGHVDGAFTFSQTACDNCHGWLSGEKTPVWGESMDNDYCLTCHTGTTVGVVKAMTAPSKQHATDRGHNRTTNYTSGNLPGNKLCTDCHLTSITNHVNATLGDATHLAAAATTCTTSCHGVGGSTIGANTKGMVTHVDRACTDCHDPHGDEYLATNIYMVRSVSTGTGNYSGSAVDFRVKSGLNSYDEADAANADDLCATCHTYGVHPLSTHNTKTNQGIAHNEGTNCFTTCHKTHKEAGGAFIAGAGTACNQCHGNPPATGAHWNGILEAHSTTGSIYTDEPRDDCARCHTGADSYTYSISADQTGGLNHSNKVGRRTILATKVGYQRDTGTNKWYCTTACHVSSKDDGFWYTWDGVTEDETTVPPSLRTPVGTSLACTACHYYDALAPSSANNSALDTPPYYRNLKGSHNAHFNKAKQCSDCHDVPVVATTTHITTSGLTEALKIEGRAQALQDEATTLPEVNLTVGNSCSGADVALGCHNTKATPPWGAGSITCTNCHTPGAGSAADPTSGLHIGPITVSGKVHNNTLGTGCATCHSSLTAQPTHYNAVFEGGNAQKIQMGLFASYTQTADDTGTCTGSGVATGCHSDLGNWARRWSATARDSGNTVCANCHGTFPNWNIGVVHAENATRGSGHSNTGSLGYGYPCTDCHVIGASTNNYLFALGSNDWNMVEGGTTKHGNNTLEINSTETFFSDAAARVGCANGTCHPIDSNHDYPKSLIYTTANTKLVQLAGVKPPVTCYNCHGGSWSGLNQSNYWPDKDNSLVESGGTSEDNQGRHDIHMKRLALAVYNEDYTTELLTDNGNGTADFKQKALCDYCHAGASNHGSKANLPAQVTTMYYLWTKEPSKTADSDASWTTTNGGSCASVNCHNGKNTNSLGTTFSWYGTPTIGTKNCTLCHNDITGADGTGVSHNAHMNKPEFGKVIACSTCHGSAVSATWDSDGILPDNYAPPTYASGHINGSLNIGTASGSGVSFTYSPNNYAGYAAHTFGSCGVNTCHNNGKYGPTTYTWGNAITGTCTACHGNTDTGLAEGHDGHLLASGVFGKTIGCADCHNAVDASNMTGMTNHMNGTVNLTVTYNGDVAVTGTTWGVCNNTACHRVSLAVQKDSPIWNTTASGCSTCHGSTAATLTSGRHEEHLPNAYIASKCGECHAANADNTSMAGQSTHFNGTVNMGGTKSVSFATPGCTNNCHYVDSANRGDWLDVGSLTCTDCHDGTFLGEIYKPLPAPPNGLHKANNALRHDDQFGVAGNCSSCHTGVNIASNTPASHMNTVTTDPNTAYGLFANYNITSRTCTASCHRDNNQWGRKWIGVEDATASGGSGQAVCNNCHGQMGSWNPGTVHYRSGTAGAAETKGQGHTTDGDPIKCEDCHGFPSVASHNSNYKVDFSGGGTAYTLAWGTHSTNPGWYCLQSGCHVASGAGTESATTSGSHTYVDSLAFPSSNKTTPQGIVYVSGAHVPVAACGGCHINVTGEFWPDGTVSPDNGGAHAVHVTEIAKKKYITASPTIGQKNGTCDYCHPGNTHGGADFSLPADVSRTDLDGNGFSDGTDPEQGSYMNKIIGGLDDTNTRSVWNRPLGTCSQVACHAAAPYTPHWYADTIAPANVTLTAALGPVPRSIKLTWVAPGDDGVLDGTAYKYDIRMGTSSGVATNFDPSPTATNYVKGVPTVKRKGEPQEAIIHGVDPSIPYYFAIRTYDRAGNFGGTANGGGYVSYTTPAAGPVPNPSLDKVAPVLTGSPSWYGLDSAKALDAPGTVKLSWTRAEDHSMPITYDLWWSTGTITYGTPQASTKDTSFRVTGLAGQSYNFTVRARDFYGNTDTNTNVLQAVPLSSLNAVPKTNGIYYANGTATTNIPMQTAEHTVNGTTATLPAVFIGPTAFSATTDLFVNGFSVNVVNSNVVSTLRAELGYITGTNTWVSFSPAVYATNVDVAKRATRLVTFKFSGVQKQYTALMNAKVGVKVSVSVGAVTSIGWGPASKGGIFTFAQQPINSSPSVPAVSTSVSGAKISIWMANPSTDATDGVVTDLVHYDVYGSANGGADGFPHVIATGLATNPTSGAPLVWDTQAAGIALDGAVNAQVKVEAGDAVNGKTLSHSASIPTNIPIDNSGDNVAPGTITNFKAETRPKQGSVYLTWTAPGDDGENNGRALSYDIRWSTAVIDDETKYNAAAANQLVSEPYPDFGGNGQGYEVLNLAAGNYFFAIKAVDEGTKTSPLAYTLVTEPTAAGPKCGICHSTPPDETATKGNHAKHGFTMTECGNCHGSESKTFATDHQDGTIKLGWKTDTPASATVVDQTVTYYQDPDAGGPLLPVKIYEDTTGAGGFNLTSALAEDDGKCFSWSNQNVSGCHGPAAEASWSATATLVCSSCHGVASRPLDAWGHSFDDPGDDVKAAPPVDNHGYDGTGATEAERKYVGAHVPHLNYSFRLSKGDSCRMCHGASRPGSSLHADGLIDVELDKAAAGDTAQWNAGTPTTAGSCTSLSLDSCHPKDVTSGGTAPTPLWDSNQSFDCRWCHGMNGSTPPHTTDPAAPRNINEPDNDPDTGDLMPGNCTWCHVGGHPKEKKVLSITKASPAVVTTANPHNLSGGEKVTIHTQTGMTEINNKTFTATLINATQFSLQGSDSTSYGTFDNGTWIEGNGTGIILIPNDSRSGINYTSGGVHLKATIGGRAEQSSEAELCWSCHDQNGDGDLNDATDVSEWGADGNPYARTDNNTATTDPGNGNDYNFGTLNQRSWIGATWNSGTTGTYGFGYKSGTIKSTHSTDTSGTTELTGTPYNYSNGGVDVVGKIHCSNCHDVHDSINSPMEADGLNPDGAPYLRGTWKGNPYKEDGAPIAGQTYEVQSTAATPGYGYGQVPRANPSTTNGMGGYWIDQNSDSPTATWSYDTSAALCQLCHSKTVDGLNVIDDNIADGGLWITTTNGHANSALGGSGAGANIFLQGAVGDGRNGADGATGGSGTKPNVNAWMGFENTVNSGTIDYGYGPRSGDGGYLTPLQTPSKVKMSVLVFAWGNAVNSTTIETGYHNFSCSKCHNPHASRLPKLMITNCLDVSHNTWDLNYDNLSTTGTVTTINDTITGKWSTFGTATSSWGQYRISHLSTAQNCHRYIDVNGDNIPDEKGWNKVTPW